MEAEFTLGFGVADEHLLARHANTFERDHGIFAGELSKAGGDDAGGICHGANPVGGLLEIQRRPDCPETVKFQANWTDNSNSGAFMQASGRDTPGRRFRANPRHPI